MERGPAEVGPLPTGNATAYLQSARDAERLRRARTDLDRIRDQNDDMVASVSHELRTPLAGMLGYVEMLAEFPALARYRDIFDSLGDASHQLIRMLETILATTTGGAEDHQA